jgi:A/G-specific adenine glycosylase
MSGLPLPAAAKLRAALLAWYDEARRDLPWRAPPGAAADPWHVLVSELMLQQTTVATIRGRFPAFLARFPTLQALADASLDDVLHAWQGLGYYRRARSLHACARAVVEQHGGRLPLDVEALKALPGVGPYTAAAVAAIAGDGSVVPVDANVERVLARLFAVTTPLPAARPHLRALAATLAAPGRAGDFAQALMELGALVCTPRRPTCADCPWRPWCAAAREKDPAAYPRKGARAERGQRYAVAFVLERMDDGAILFRRRPETGLLGGMIELPSTPWLADRPQADAAIAASAPARLIWTEIEGEVRHQFSHIDLTCRLVRGRLADAAVDGIWMPPARFGELALPTMTGKLLRQAGLSW